MNYVAASGKEEMEQCHNEIHSLSAKASYVKAVEDNLFSEICGIKREAVEDANRIKNEALQDMKQMASTVDVIFRKRREPDRHEGRFGNCFERN
jgi:hypothetical protein